VRNGLPGRAPLLRLLEQIDYIHPEIAIHSDVSYMPRDRRLWSEWNIQIHPECSEWTMWVGRHQGAPVFKTWITHRTWCTRRQCRQRVRRAAPGLQQRRHILEPRNASRSMSCPPTTSRPRSSSTVDRAQPRVCDNHTLKPARRRRRFHI